jgi:hypothetical protein
MMKPMPNAAPSVPNAAARFSFGVMSAIYAFAVEKLAAQTPEIARPTNSSHSDGASAINDEIDTQPEAGNQDDGASAVAIRQRPLHRRKHELHQHEQRAERT